MFLLLTSIGCSNQLNLEKHTDLVFKESYYQSWVSGVKGGGSGLIIFLTLGDSSSKNIQLEGIYFKDKYSKLTSKSDLKYQCTILKNENRETNSFIKPIENTTKEIEKIPSVQKMLNHKYFCSLLIGKGQDLLFEKYANDFTEETPQTIMSITKMFVNLFVGELVENKTIEAPSFFFKFGRTFLITLNAP